jgi:hypothetical protein
MGYMRHHAIVITTYGNNVEKAKAIIIKIFGIKTVPQFDALVNGYVSFFIPPDGSKEGWSESDECDKKREKLKKWLDKQKHGDGSSPFAWAEVQYGDEDMENKITDCSN